MVTDFLRLENVSKRFGKLNALYDVSFAVERGEIVGLIGPNGAGKTTLFNVVTGFYGSSSGKIIFRGKDVTKASPNKLATMGLVRTFQIPRPCCCGYLIQSQVKNLTSVNRKICGENFGRTKAKPLEGASGSHDGLRQP